MKNLFFEKSSGPLTIAVFLFGSFFASNTAQAAPQVVSGNTSAGFNQPGWLFGRDLGFQTPFQFSVDQSSVGSGSLYIPPITNTVSTPDGNKDKFIAENFLLTQLADINIISYDFMIASTSGASFPHFYMNVYANFGTSSPTKFFDCVYNVVPTSGSLTGFTTVTFDPTLTYPVRQAGSSPYTCPSSPADMNTLSPSSIIRAIVLNVGDTSGSDTGVSGYLDNVIVNTNSGTTITDFDPDLTPPVITLNGTTPDIARNGTYTELGATADDGSTVVVSGSVDTSLIGSYLITYNATDVAGNIATPVIRTVNVIEIPIVRSGGRSGGSRRTVPTLPPQASPVAVLAVQPGQVLGASTLGMGSRGQEVVVLQDKLRSAGFFKLNSTGYFGPITQAALVAYEKANGPMENAGAVLGASTDKETEAKISQVKSQLAAAITQLIQLLQAKLNSAR